MPTGESNVWLLQVQTNDAYCPAEIETNNFAAEAPTDERAFTSFGHIANFEVLHWPDQPEQAAQRNPAHDLQQRRSALLSAQRGLGNVD